MFNCNAIGWYVCNVIDFMVYKYYYAHVKYCTACKGSYELTIEKKIFITTYQ